jgi:hypothetical protein
MEQIPWGATVRRPQLSSMNSPDMPGGDNSRQSQAPTRTSGASTLIYPWARSWSWRLPRTMRPAARLKSGKVAIAATVDRALTAFLPTQFDVCIVI